MDSFFDDKPRGKIKEGTITKVFTTDNPDKGIKVDYFMKDYQCVGVESNYVKVL